MIKLNPLHNRVVVRRIEPTLESAGGIIIPDNVAEKPDRAFVLAVGPGFCTKEGTMIPMTVKEGDQVIFPARAGQQIKIDGEELLILGEDEIFAVITE